MIRRAAAGARVLTLLAALALATWGSGSPPALASTTPASWTAYHGAPDGSGVAPDVASVDLSHRAWTSPALDGQLYGAPVVFGDRVFIATENDTVDALDASSGRVVWSTHVGAPVASSSLPCGDIAPTLGITGTPVIDPARSEIFVVADELVRGQPAHELVGLDTDTGKVELTQDVDPSGSTPSALLQRTGLILDGGHVVFGFGGHYGDCSTYRGWVVSVPEAGGAPTNFGVDSGPGESRGAIWMGGAAPVIDSAGNIWVTAGNGSVTAASHAYDNSDSVLELSPALSLVQYFAPSSWASDNAHDLDLSSAPALLANGEILAAGKSRIVYLLAHATLGGIGGQQAQLPDACGDNIDGGIAINGSTVYMPCLAGPIAVQTSTAPVGLRLLWHASVGGGPPVLAGGRVWTISTDGTIFGLDPGTGAVLAHADVGLESNHFPTPSFGAGLMLVPTALRVVAFAAASTGTTTTTTAGTSTTARHAPSTTTSAARAAPPPSEFNAGVIAAFVAGGLVLAGVAVWLASRRRAR